MGDEQLKVIAAELITKERQQRKSQRKSERKSRSNSGGP